MAGQTRTRHIDPETGEHLHRRKGQPYDPNPTNMDAVYQAVNHIRTRITEHRPVEMVLLVVLASYVDDDWIVQGATDADLASLCGVSMPTFKLALEKLKTNRLIDHASPSGGGIKLIKVEA